MDLFVGFPPLAFVFRDHKIHVCCNRLETHSATKPIWSLSWINSYAMSETRYSRWNFLRGPRYEIGDGWGLQQSFVTKNFSGSQIHSKGNLIESALMQIQLFSWQHEFYFLRWWQLGSDSVQLFPTGNNGRWQASLPKCTFCMQSMPVAAIKWTQRCKDSWVRKLDLGSVW